MLNDATHLVVVDTRQAGSFRSTFRSAMLLVDNALASPVQLVQKVQIEFRTGLLFARGFCTPLIREIPPPGRQASRACETDRFCTTGEAVR